jgi:hypothetical protein
MHNILRTPFLFLAVHALLAVSLAGESVQNEVVPAPSNFAVWSFATEELLKLSGCQSRSFRLRRSSDGAFFYVVETSDDGCVLHIVEGASPSQAVTLAYEDAFLSDEKEIICWQINGDFHFRNGAVIRKPMPSWEDISGTVSMTKGGVYYLKDGSVTDFRKYPHFRLWVSPGGQYCLFLVGDKASIYRIESSSNQLIIELDDFYAHGGSVSTVFGTANDVYVVGFERSRMKGGPIFWHFRKSSNEYALYRKVSLKGIDSVSDVDYAGQTVLGMKWSDLFRNKLISFSLIKQKSSRIARGVNGAMFIAPEVRDEITTGDSTIGAERVRRGEGQPARVDNSSSDGSNEQPY